MMGDGLDRGVRPVRRTERIVHVEVGQRRQRRREPILVLFLFGMEPQILEQHHAGTGRVDLVDRLLDLVTDAVVEKRHRLPEQLRQPASRSAAG